MLKKELIEGVSALSGVPKKTVREVLDAMCDVTASALAVGDSVMLAGVGKLTVNHRGPKAARNLKTGEKVIVPARNVVVLAPSDMLTRVVNAS